MNHLHIVARSGGADPVAARLTVDLSSSLLEDVLDSGPRSLRPTGHERRAVAGAFLTSRDTGSYKE